MGKMPHRKTCDITDNQGLMSHLKNINYSSSGRARSTALRSSKF